MTTAAPASNNRQQGTRAAIAAILAISAAATLFLFWLIYVHPAAASSSQYAFFAGAQRRAERPQRDGLLVGYTFIRARRIAAHRAAMITAFGFSTLFLISYIAHHALHGDVRYPAPRGFARRSTCRCWPATFFWPLWRCRWCWSPSFSRLAGGFRNIARLPAGPFRCGSTFRSPAW